MQLVTKDQSCWRSRSTLGRWHMLMFLFACLAVASHATSLEVCNSDQCNYTASTVWNKMNTLVQPCDDFYQFACGNFNNTIIKRKNKFSVNAISITLDKLQRQLRDILEKERQASDPHHLRLPNKLYDACMNTALIETLDMQPMMQISDSLGGWPAVVGDSWNSDNSWSWQETIKKFRRLGFSVNQLFSFSIVDLKSSNKRIIKLHEPSLGLPKEYYNSERSSNDSTMNAYCAYVLRAAELFGANIETARKEILKSLKFEEDLGYISTTNYRFDKYYTVEQFQKSYGYVQWVDLINALLPEGLQINQYERIIFSEPIFFRELGNLLWRTDKRVIANYLMSRIHTFSLPYLSRQFRHLQMKFDTVLLGAQEQKGRWRECVDIVTHSGLEVEDKIGLTIAVGSLYVRKQFQQNSKAMVEEIAENIRSTFLDTFTEAEWMDEITKQQGKEKLLNMTTRIGYTDEMLDNKEMENLYRKLEVNPDKYFESILNINIFDTDYSFNNLRLPLNANGWIKYSKSADIIFSHMETENSIYLPAGILHDHFFHYQRPKYMNYGAIGRKIGQLITHGLDKDALKNVTHWLQPKSRNSYLAKIHCIKGQIDKHTDVQSGLNLEGDKLRNVNVDDNGGVMQSYLAYNKWVAQNGEEPSLPGLNYTGNQMFWISTAQAHCAKFNTKYLRRMITEYSLTPHQFRVVGPLRNMIHFARDFNCAAGSPMNPRLKCELW